MTLLWTLSLLEMFPRQQQILSSFFLQKSVLLLSVIIRMTYEEFVLHRNLGSPNLFHSLFVVQVFSFYMKQDRSYFDICKDWGPKKVTIYFPIFYLVKKIKNLSYSFTCILPDCVANEITKEFWKNSHFENRRAGFLLGCQNSVR